MKLFSAQIKSYKIVDHALRLRDQQKPWIFFFFFFFFWMPGPSFVCFLPASDKGSRLSVQVIAFLGEFVFLENLSST